MDLWQVVLLSVVEGLTEFVPVSSTGHLILVSRFLGQKGPAVDAFLVVVQLGALLAAVWYYRRTLLETVVGLWNRDPAAFRLLRNLCLGSLPLLVVGYGFGKRIKAVHLKNFEETDCGGGLHGFGDDLSKGVVDFKAVFALDSFLEYVHVQ